MQHNGADKGFQVLTFREVAELLKVSELTLIRMRRKDDSFPKSIFGGRLQRYTYSSIVEWCNNRVAGGAAKDDGGGEHERNADSN